MSKEGFGPLFTPMMRMRVDVCPPAPTTRRMAMQTRHTQWGGQGKGWAVQSQTLGLATEHEAVLLYLDVYEPYGGHRDDPSRQRGTGTAQIPSLRHQQIRLDQVWASYIPGIQSQGPTMNGARQRFLPPLLVVRWMQVPISLGREDTARKQPHIILPEEFLVSR